MKHLTLFFLFFTFFTTKSAELNLSNQAKKVLARELERNFGTADYKIVKKLSVGGSGASLQVIEVNGKEYVLRIISSKRTDIQIESEFIATEISSILNIGPKLYFYDLESRLILTDYVPPLNGKTIDYPDKVTEDMAVYLARLNKVNINSNDQSFRQALDNFKSWNIEKLSPEMQERLRKVLAKVLDSHNLFRDFQPMLAHNDLHFGNLIVAKRKSYIIDWEEFYISNAPFELAATIYRVVADESLKESLLKSFYNREPTELDYARFRIGAIIYLFMQGVNDLSSLADGVRYNISYEEYKNLPSPTTFLREILHGQEKINDNTKKVYFWSLLKKVDDLVSEKEFSKNLKLISKAYKKEKKDFKKTILDSF